jgi:hypothetical protein
MKKRIIVFGNIGLLAMLALTVLSAQSDPFIGTWKQDMAKSKYSPGPAPKSRTETVETQVAGVKYTSEGTAADGGHFAWSFTTNYDGKDTAISGTGVPAGADTIAVQRINPSTATLTFKKAGKVVLSGRQAVSKDAKVMTITAKGTNADGQPTNNVLVLEKQ